MEFYNVKTKQTVRVADKECIKTKKVSATGRTTYMIQGVDKDGNKVCRITNEASWKSLKCKEA